MFHRKMINKRDFDSLNSKTNYKIHFSLFPQVEEKNKIIFEITYLNGFYKLKTYLFDSKGNFINFYKYKTGVDFSKHNLFKDLKLNMLQVLSGWEKKIKRN